jgi:large subunit ribosomal protein L15
MVVKRRKKITKYRGSRTCGWGLVHRGSGQKGGAGNAGSGKKANSKAPRVGLWAKQLMGKHGFIHHGAEARDVTINLRDLEDRLPAFLEAKTAAESGGVVAIDLAKAGYTKVLSAGRVTRKWKITAAKASPDAVEKVKAAGGELSVAKSETKPAAKPARAE